MKSRMVFGSIVMMLVLAIPANGQLQKYFSDAAKKVKATENASEKRIILNESFQTMSKALDKVQSLALISENDRVGIERLKATLREKQDELAGLNGFARVSDEQLNTFSDYVVQDTEQAEVVLTISLVTLLLIIIIIILLT